MANRYWVGGTGDWNATAGSKWSTTSGGAGGSAAPTAADDVYIDLGSGSVTVTVPASTTVVCRSLNFVDGTGGAFTGTFVMADTTSIITIGDGTAGAGNNALKIASGMTWTNTAVGTINFISTSATQQTITSGGKTLPTITINGAGSSYILGDALTQVVTGVVTTFKLVAGTFNTGNYNMTTLIWNVATAGTKTLTLGSSAITAARNATAIQFDPTGLTVTANTAVFTCTAQATVSMTNTNMNGASIVFTSNGNATMQNGGTWANVTRTGTGNKTDTLIVSVTGFTVTGTLTLTANSDINRIFVNSNVRGSSRTITAANVVIANTVDFMDITGAGAATWTAAGTGATYLGDCQGNSGITFTTPVTRYAVASGNWSSTGMWSTSSGGSSGASVPLPQDTVYLDGSSASGTYTVDMPRMGKDVDFTGFTRTAGFGSTNIELYGSLTLASGMTLTGANNVSFAGRGTHTITSAGKTILGASTINAPGGTYTLADAFTSTNANGLAVLYGGFVSAGYTITSGSFASSGSTTRSVDITNSTVNLTAAGTPWTCATATGLTFTSTGSTIVISTAGTSTRSFSGGGLTYNNLTYTVANSPGAVNIVGNNSFNNITIGSGRVFTATSNAVQTVRGNILGSGVVNGYQYLGGGASNYISTPDSAALSITGNITLLGRVAMDDWTPATNMTVIGKSNSSSNKSFQLIVNSSTGKLLFVASADGTTNVTTTSSVATGFTDGTTNWVLASFRASDGRVQFFTASGSITNPVASDFTQLGTDQNNGLTSIFDSTIEVEIGSIASGSVNMLAGKVYRAKIYNGLFSTVAFGGTVQLDADFTAKAFGANSFTESSSNAATVTITGVAAQAGDGRLTISSATAGSITSLSKPSGGILTSSSDYLVVQDIVMYQPLSFFAGANSVDGTGNTAVYFTAPGTYGFSQGIAVIASSVTSISTTYPVATVAGNLLVAYFNSLAGTTGGLTPPSGWTQATTVTQSSVTHVYYKIADGTETTVTFSQVSTRNLQLYIQEFSGFTGTPTLDVTDTNQSASTLTTLSTNGANPSNTVQPALALAMLTNSSTLSTVTGITNSFIQDSIPRALATSWIFAAKELTTTAAVNTTFSWTTARANSAAHLVVFIDVASTASGNFLVFF